MKTQVTVPSPSGLDADPQIVIEEAACMIAEAQAALFAGRYRELEVCAARLQKVCEVLQGSSSTVPTSRPGDPPAEHFLPRVERVQHQNKVFAATLRRLRRHFESLRNVLNGRSLSYQPQRVVAPERKS